MTTSPEKVLELLANQRITAAEADSLLAAMKPRGSVSWWSWVLNPIERLPGPAVAALTAVAVAFQLFLERWGIEFDGAIDVHGRPHPVGWPMAVIHTVISFPFVAAVLWGTARALTRQSIRFVDLWGAVGLSRWPAFVTGFFALRMSALGVERLMHPGPGELLLIFGCLPFVAWNIALLCLGFRTVSGLRGSRLAWGFIGALVVAEAFSKVALLALAPIAGR